MKIAIITFHAAKNFGAVLQAYGLQSALERMGHEPCFPHVRSDHQLVSKYRRKHKFSIKSLIRRMTFKVIQGRLDRRIANFDRFVEERIRTTERYLSHDEVAQSPPDVDAYVCGSDQIWNLEKGIGRYFFLDFVPDGKRRISYAPSFGTADIPDEYRADVRSLLLKFDSLSVRERQAQDLVKSLIGQSPELVCDPIFLLDSSFWEDIALKPSFARPYLVFYSLESTPDLSACVSHLAGRYKLPVVVLAKGGSFVLRHRTILAIESGPEQFLGWIRHAALVVTNSFHATAFSIHFRVPFVTVAHTTRNSRMESLLDELRLGSRMVAGCADLRSREDEWNQAPFDSESDEALEAIVKRSHDFLEQSLS